MDSGSNYRVAHRTVAPDGTVGEQQLLTRSDTNSVERTIFPSLARLDDGSLVIAYTDRLSEPNGNLGAVVQAAGSDHFSCAFPLTTGTGGNIDANLAPRPTAGSLLYVYLAGTADPFPIRFGRLDVADLPELPAR